MNKKQVINKEILKNNNIIKEAIDKNYDNEIEVIDQRSYHKETKNLLISPTRLINTFTEQSIVKIPKNILNEAAAIGSDLMHQLEYAFTNKVKDISKINYLCEQSKQMFWALVQFLINNNWEIKAVEKHITNGYFHSYIDMIVRNHEMRLIVCEIKTRSNNEVKLSDKLQLMLSMRILGVDREGYVIIINRKTYEVTYHKVFWQEMRLIVKRIIELFSLLGANNGYYNSILQKKNK